MRQYKVPRQSFVLSMVAGGLGAYVKKLEGESEEEYRNRLLALKEKEFELGKKQFMQTHALGMMGLFEQRAARKEAREFQEKMLPLTTEQQKEIDAFRSMLKQKEAKVEAEARKPSRIDTWLDRLVKTVGVENIRSQMVERKARTDLAADKFDFEKTQFTWEKQVAKDELLYKYAEMAFDADTAIALEQYSNNVKIWLADRRVGDMSRHLMREVSYYNYLAVTAVSNKNRNAAIKEADHQRSLLSQALDKEAGIKYTPPKVEWERTLRHSIAGEYKEVGEPKLEFPPRGAPPTYEGIRGADVPTPGEPYGFAPPGADVKAYAEELREAGVTAPLSPEQKRVIEEAGYDPDEVENALK